MTSKWHRVLLAVIIAMLFPAIGLAKQIPYPTDPPDMSVYNGTPEQVYDEVIAMFTVSLSTMSGQWPENATAYLVRPEKGRLWRDHKQWALANRRFTIGEYRSTLTMRHLQASGSLYSIKTLNLRRL